MRVAATVLVMLAATARAATGLALAQRPGMRLLRSMATTAAATAGAGPLFLMVPFDQRDQVKTLGARWDSEVKKWYIPPGVDPKPFSQWVRIFLKVPFADKDKVKALGASWDTQEGKWCAPAGSDLKAFASWIEVAAAKEPPVNAAAPSKTIAASLSVAAQAVKLPVAKKSWEPAPASPPPVSAQIEKPVAVKKGWGPVAGVKSAAAISVSNREWDPVIPDDTPARTSTFTNKTSPVRSATPTHNSAATTNKAAPVRGGQGMLNSTVLLIDCDTNGLPQDIRSTYPPYSSLKSYDSARIVQLSFALCNRTTLQPLSQGSFIIKSDGFPIDNTDFHGITGAVSQRKGVAFEVAAQALMEAVRQTNLVLAHNSEFVCNVVKSELFRHALLDEVAELDAATEVCTMLGTRQLLQLKDKTGRMKPISLKELVRFALDEDLPEMHNSQVDVQFLRRALKALVEGGKFSIAQ